MAKNNQAPHPYDVGIKKATQKIAYEVETLCSIVSELDVSTPHKQYSFEFKSPALKQHIQVIVNWDEN